MADGPRAGPQATVIIGNGLPALFYMRISFRSAHLSLRGQSTTQCKGTSGCSPMNVVLGWETSSTMVAGSRTYKLDSVRVPACQHENPRTDALLI